MKKIISMMVIMVMMMGMMVAVAGCGGSSSSKSEEESDFTPVVWKFGNQHNSEQIATILDKEICEEVKKATEGRVTIDLYTDSALGDYTSVFDELMMGTVQMAHITGVESYDPRITSPMLPYLVTDYETSKKAYRKDGYLFKQVTDALDAQNIRLMGLFPEGFVGIGSKVKLNQPAAVGVEKGALVRVPMLDVFALSTKDLGFRVSSIAYSDSYAALQTGVVDGMDGNGALATYSAFGDVTNYFYDYRHLQEATMIMINKDAWNELLPKDQKAIEEIITAKCIKAIEMAEESDTKYKGKMSEKGIEVIEFSDEELAAFAKSCHENVWPQLAKKYPQGFMEDLLADIEK
jgi:TRAP-type C4-dicarboxylate transport system substrate-binding protein